MEGFFNVVEENSEHSLQDSPSVSPVVPRKLKREDAQIHSQKRPMKRPYEDIYDEDEQPDLHEYFSNWSMEPKDIVLMCRSYASYVATQQKSQKK